MPDSVFVDLYAGLWARIFGLERYARKPSPGQMSLFGDDSPAGGKHDVSQEPRDDHGQWTAGAAAPKKTEESPKPDVVSPDSRATLRQDETKPALESTKMSGELYSDDKRTVRVDDNGRYTIVPADGREPREVHPFGDLMPIDRAPPGVAAAVKKQGLRDYVWYGGLAMPRAAATAIHDHYNGEQDRQQAEYNASHPGAAERREVDAMLDRARRIQDDNYGRATSLRLDAQDKLAAWRKKYPKEAAEEQRHELADAAAHHRDLASGAMLYDADGSLSSEDQKRRADEFNAKADELDRQAKEIGQ
jgi:hypothetical protein